MSASQGQTPELRGNISWNGVMESIFEISVYLVRLSCFSDITKKKQVSCRKCHSKIKLSETFGRMKSPQENTRYKTTTEHKNDRMQSWITRISTTSVLTIQHIYLQVMTLEDKCS